jgi:hypothetical protein
LTSHWIVEGARGPGSRQGAALPELVSNLRLDDFKLPDGSFDPEMIAVLNPDHGVVSTNIAEKYGGTMGVTARPGEFCLYLKALLVYLRRIAATSCCIPYLADLELNQRALYNSPPPPPVPRLGRGGRVLVILDSAVPPAVEDLLQLQFAWIFTPFKLFISCLQMVGLMQVDALYALPLVKASVALLLPQNSATGAWATP